MWKLRVGLQRTSPPRVASSKAVPPRVASSAASLCASGCTMSMRPGWIGREKRRGCASRARF
eukprot:scaffold2343_cov58-Phaeocystis_antarctica.AAC.4